MNILFLHSAIDLYGASKVAIETTKVLLRDGHHVVFVVSKEGPICDELRAIGCEVKVLPLATLRRKYFSFKGLINRFIVGRQSFIKLKELVEHHAIDVVYSNTTSILIGAILSSVLRLKHIWHVHETPAGPTWLQKIFAYLLKKRTDRVIVVSDAIKELWLGVRPDLKMHRVYNGFEDTEPRLEANMLRNELGLHDDTLIVGMVARVHFWKGQEYFLELANKIKQYQPDVKFVMIGDAYPGYEYLYEEINTTKERLGLNEDVVDLGYRTDALELMQGFDLFVLASTAPDPLPTTVLEAMSLAKPVVATNHGGATEMVLDQLTGVLIPWDNATTAMTCIEPLIEDEALRKRMGKNGKKRLQDNFSFAQYQSSIRKIMEGLNP